MQLPTLDRIDTIIDALTYPSEYNIDSKNVEKLQIEIDSYAKQNPDNVILSRLLLAQALIHYQNNNDNEALNFATAAINHGLDYQVAYDLVSTLNATDYDIKLNPNSESEYVVDESLLTEEEKKRQLIGLNGWLAWYCLGLIISIPWSTYNLFKDGLLMANTDIELLNNYQTGLGSKFMVGTLFENISILIYIALSVAALILIIKRSKNAKTIAILGLAFGAAYSIIDYLLIYGLIQSSGLYQMLQSDAEYQTYMNQYYRDIGRTIIAALIWIPYFLVSRRVKATLTR